MAPEGDVVEENGENGEQHTQEERHGEERPHDLRVQDPGQVREGHDHVAEELDHRAQELEAHEGRERQEADRAVAGFPTIARCRSSVSRRPRCQRLRWRRSTRSVSGTSVQQTGFGTKRSRYGSR